MTSRRIAAALLATSFLSAPALARADDAPAPPSAAPARVEKATTWYGYQTLVTDGVALALLIPATSGSLGASSQGFGVGSLVMYGLGAPIVHFSHGQVAKGFIDLGLRAGTPIVTTLLGFAIGSAIPANDPEAFLDSTNHAFEGAALGLVAGPILASAVDAAVLAREPADRDGASDAKPPPPPPTAKLQPSFGVTPERQGGTRTTVGVMGTF